MYKYNLLQKQEDKIERAIKDVVKNKSNIYPLSYRPFDKLYCIYTGVSNGVMGRPRNTTMKHFIDKSNVAIIVSRTVYGGYAWNDIQITKYITEKGIMAMRVGNAAIVCPLYIYIDNDNQTSTENIVRLPNLNPIIVQELSDALNLTFTNEKETTENTFAPIDLLDYIYAVLHSPAYRKKYEEFLKIDFPRVPYPKDVSKFWQLVELGGKLRQIHLLESATVTNYISGYPVDGDNIITALKYDDGKVYINSTQYFDNVPASAWAFYIGGYQPAQKWLKDRKGRELSFEDINHYRSIIVALHETEKLMAQIDEIGVE